MKKSHILVAIITFVIVLSSLGRKEIKTIAKAQKSTGPPACYAKEPPNNVSCTMSGCHSDHLANTGNALLSLDLGDAGAGYSPNQTYNININLSKAGMLRAGFQIIAVQDNDQLSSPGTITLSNKATTQILNVSDTHGGNCDATHKTWVEHTFAGTDVSGGNTTWTYQWKAPDTDVGNITFYLAALEANDDQDNLGDYTYTLSKSMAFNPVQGLADFYFNNIRIYPNPSSDVVNLTYNHQITLDEIELLDAKGESKKVLNKQAIHMQESGNISMDLKEMDSGVYFIKIKSGGSSLIKKVVLMQ